MAYYPDLSPCTYLPLEAPNLLAVGWLDATHDHARGEVSREFYDALVALAKAPWEPVAAAGHHTCELCQFDGAKSYSIVFVPGDGVVYAAPTGIAHYVATHRYRPPQVFVDAVLACPPMRSMAYMKALLATGGKELVNPTPPPGAF